MAMETRDLLLKEAEALMRTRGYAAFSYADLSERVGIRKASIHHHFPSKEALGQALIDSYLENFDAALAAVLAEETSAEARLSRYAGFFVASMADGMMPLCGALSAEAFVLPNSLQSRVHRFFDMHLEWLEKVVGDGIEAGELRAGTAPRRIATLILSTMEGASLVAWAVKDGAVIEPAFRDLYERLKA